MALVRYRKLAIPQRIPQLDGAVARAGHDLAVVGRKGHGEHVIGVPHEAAGRVASCEFPEAERLVPGGGEGVGAIGGDDLSNFC